MPGKACRQNGLIAPQLIVPVVVENVFLIFLQ
jgi:hypothetical protein